MSDDGPIDPALWEACGHTVRFPHCAGCDAELDPGFGVDGPVLVAAGVCDACSITTVWQYVNADRTADPGDPK